jgi:hypothetical protein
MSAQCLSFVAIALFLLASDRANAQPAAPVWFYDFLSKRFSNPKTEWKLESFCPVGTSVVAKRVLESYGSMFSTHESVVLPDVCIQPGEGAVIQFQKQLQIKPVDINGVRLNLQPPAADALSLSISQANERGFRISPLDGAIAGGRTYGDTLMLWNSRFIPALEFWLKRGRLSTADVDRIHRVELLEKVEMVLEWEKAGIYFSKSRTQSVLTSTAPPGTSQHLSLIAFDVVEYWNPEVRSILNNNGWYQTVVDDPPHFTYLGHPAADLPGRGLRFVAKGGFHFWIPNLPQVTASN